MKITARYVDTCLSDYLQDGCNRPGQALCLTSPGCTLDESVDALYDSMDWDSGLPESVFDADIKDAFRLALQGVDLRYIDGDGNRLDETPEEISDDCAGDVYIYVVLEWDATVVAMTMTVDVDYYANGTDPYKLKLLLEDAIRQAAANGALTGGLPAEVKDWGATASPKGDEPGKEGGKWVTLRDPHT